MLTAMLTLSARHGDIDRARILLDSLEHYLAGPMNLTVIIRDEHYEQVVEALSDGPYRKLTLSMMKDGDLLHPDILSGEKVRPTVKQMLIKMLFSQICKDPHYITLDADVALIKPFDVRDAFSDGKAFIQTKQVTGASRWVEAAGKVLGVPAPYGELMDVTPAIISVEGMKSLLRFLEEKYGAHWQRALADLHGGGVVWTEYTLYWYHLLNEGTLGDLHPLGTDNRIYVTANVWRPEQIEKWSLAKARASKGWFVILQSSSGLTPEQSRAMLRDVIEPARKPERQQDASGADDRIDALTAEVRTLRQLLRVQAHKMLVVHKALAAMGTLGSSNLDEPHSEATPEVRHIKGSSTLVLSFGSKGQGIFSARPELSGTLTRLDVDSIYYRDFLQAWWYQGLLGLTKDIPTTVNYLSDVIKAGGYERVITTGNSMGAYAAILFGVALNADRIVAFSPQTKVNIREFKHFGGTDAQEVKYDFRSQYADLKTVVAQSTFTGAIDIFYGTRAGFDHVHAEHLGDFPFVRLHPLETDSHNVAAILKAENKLDSLFTVEPGSEETAKPKRKRKS